MLELEGPGMIYISGIGQNRPSPVTESRLHIGDVVMRREDTARTGVSVVETLVGDMRVTQTVNPCHLLPGTFRMERVSFRHLSSSVRQPRELRLELRCTESAFLGWSKGEF